MVQSVYGIGSLPAAFHSCTMDCRHISGEHTPDTIVARNVPNIHHQLTLHSSVQPPDKKDGDPHGGCKQLSWTHCRSCDRNLSCSQRIWGMGSRMAIHNCSHSQDNHPMVLKRMDPDACILVSCSEELFQNRISGHVYFPAQHSVPIHGLLPNWLKSQSQFFRILHPG